MNSRIYFFIFLYFPFSIFAQNQLSKQQYRIDVENIHWNSPASVKISDTETQQFISFDGAVINRYTIVNKAW